MSAPYRSNIPIEESTPFYDWCIALGSGHSAQPPSQVAITHVLVETGPTEERITLNVSGFDTFDLRSGDLRRWYRLERPLIVQGTDMLSNYTSTSLHLAGMRKRVERRAEGAK